MDTSGIRAALAATMEAARFRLVLRPVEHSHPQPGGGKRRKDRKREPTGDWVVFMAAGSVLAGPEGENIAKEINSALTFAVDDRFWPLVTSALATFERTRQSEHLVALEAMFKKHEAARAITLYCESLTKKIMPTGGGEVRFDAADWTDAEKAATRFVTEINDTITRLIAPAVARLYEDLSNKIRNT